MTERALPKPGCREAESARTRDSAFCGKSVNPRPAGPPIRNHSRRVNAARDPDSHTKRNTAKSALANSYPPQSSGRHLEVIRSFPGQPFPEVRPRLKRTRLRLQRNGCNALPPTRFAATSERGVVSPIGTRPVLMGILLLGLADGGKPGSALSSWPDSSGHAMVPAVLPDQSLVCEHRGDPCTSPSDSRLCSC